MQVAELHCRRSGKKMQASTGRILWSAFGALFLLVTVGATLNLLVLQMEQKQQSRSAQVYEPLLQMMMSMDRDISGLLAAARGYTLTQKTEFSAQYDEAVRNFQKGAAAAEALAQEPRDRALVRAIREHFFELKAISDDQVDMTDAGEGPRAIDKMLEAARKRRSAYDFAGTFAEAERIKQAEQLRRLDGLRLALTLLLVGSSVAILFLGAFAVIRIDRSLKVSVNRQIKRTEAMIAGMADGTMLVDGEGRVVFINPAAQAILGNSTVGVPIEKQAEIYGFRDPSGQAMNPGEIPAARALGTGRAVKEVPVAIAQPGGRSITVSMSAVPLQEEDRVTGVIVTFRDITERQRLEEEMQLQAERAQILADAGAFFASNVDPVWVTQAIAERVAEVLGDWTAVILRVPQSTELQVAAIYHRDMASLGLAWSYIYRQPLVIGEGVIGQVISSGYPSLTSNFAAGPQKETETYHAVQMKLSSLLVLPLRTRREIIGALVIAANDPVRQMNDEKLPLAEVLAERAALAIENARLYTEQVEARQKVEDLSRLKDEFLSIASHELRTPVTSIKGYTQLAKTMIHENDLSTSEEYLAVALEQIDRMSRLILELLDVSRIETGRLEIRRERIYWAHFIRDVVNHHHTASRDRRFHLDVPGSGKLVEGDRDRLEQVLGNLLDNAVKYSPDGSEVFVRVADEGERVVTSISDRGIGIPTDELGQVFERFHRGRQVSSTNYGGLGLGLYISKQIIERHGGSIWVESREGQGTTFHFSLPAQAAASDGDLLKHLRHPELENGVARQ
ncbi:MAG TPA: ATP-binding protein [Thermoanaerobaculia bacterium]|nr:ATP-binding protein [Thermoanaerobaculia bacterium]